MLGKLKKLFGKDDRNPYPNEFTNLILAHADAIGWNIVIRSESRIAISFDEENGRSQTVHVLCFEQKSGRKIACITSAAGSVNALKETKADLKTLFNELLTENERATYHSWALTEDDDDLLITANANFVLDNLSRDEFESAVAIISEAADKLEARLGGDDF